MTDEVYEKVNKFEPMRQPDAPAGLAAASGSASLYSTVPLPDGIVIGGPWPHTIVSWPGGKSRGATKPEYDLFQALEKAHAEIEALRAQMPNAESSDRKPPLLAE